MHVHGMGSPADLAKRVKPAIDLIDQAAKKTQAAASTAPAQASATLDGATLAKIIGTP
jgi:ribosomal protein L16/L10AE